jgi:hypothetical protein
VALVQLSKEGTAADVEVLVVGCLRALVGKRAGGVVCQCPRTGLLDVAWGTLEAGRNDFAVVGEVDEFGRGGFGFVVKQVDRWLTGRLTTSVVGVAAAGMDCC